MKHIPAIMIFLSWMAILLTGCRKFSHSVNVASEPYTLDFGLVSRSISFENPTGQPGQGGHAASDLGVGRKGNPAILLKAGQAVALCDIQGPGTIRHIWITTKAMGVPGNVPEIFRGLVLRAWYENQAYPSIECPLGDFMGFAHGQIAMPYHSAVHAVGERAGMSFYLPMPFTRRIKMNIINESSKDVRFFYQIDYTLGEKHPVDVGRLHVLFRRENPTTYMQDFELLPQRNNKGRYIGAVIGIRNLNPAQWWGEGEIKFYLDGDRDFPSICGTGSEDYVGLSWGIQQTPFLYNGCSLSTKEYTSMYRWHLPDPIYWNEQCRITIQQIAYRKGKGLVETQDDWSSATFWYEPVPSEPLPQIPDAAQRIAEISSENR